MTQPAQRMCSGTDHIRRFVGQQCLQRFDGALIDEAVVFRCRTYDRRRLAAPVPVIAGL